jgi:hypothetical protein
MEGDRGFETGQKTGAILENSRLNDSSEAARRHPLNRGREKTRIMVWSWLTTGSHLAAIAGISVQIVRDWVVKFNAHGPEGLMDPTKERKS